MSFRVKVCLRTAGMSELPDSSETAGMGFINAVVVA